MLKKLGKFIIIFCLLISVAGVVYADFNYDIGIVFVPYETKSLVAINIKKIFQLYNYDEINELSFIKKNKGIKKFIKILFNIMKNGEIDTKSNLRYMVISKPGKINYLSNKLISDSVIIVKLLYDTNKLSKAILSVLKKRLKVKLKRKSLKGKIIIDLGKSFYGYSIFMLDNRTILLGKRKKIIKYSLIYLDNKKNISSKIKFKSALKIIRRQPIFSFYFESPQFFKNLLEQKNENFKMKLEIIKNIEGKIDSTKKIWNIDIRLISNDDKSNKITVNSLRKLIAMGAMGGQEYVKWMQRMSVNIINGGIRFFLSFEVE